MKSSISSQNDCVQHPFAQEIWQSYTSGYSLIHIIIIIIIIFVIIINLIIASVIIGSIALIIIITTTQIRLIWTDITQF